MNKHIKKDTETDYCYGQHKSDVQNIQTHMTMKPTKPPQVSLNKVLNIITGV